MTDEPTSTARIPAVDDVDFIRKRLKELADERAENEKNRPPEPPAAFSIDPPDLRQQLVDLGYSVIP
jgi:hypothetical protein